MAHHEESDVNTYFTAHGIGYDFSYLYERAKKRFAKRISGKASKTFRRLIKN